MHKTQEIDPKAIYDIWLGECTGINNSHGKILIDYFGSAERVYKADKDELICVTGITNKIISKLINKNLTKASKVLESCKRAGCSVLTLSDSRYPERLRNIYDPPVVLYIKGSLPQIDDMPVVGIVGTRSCTPYGYTHAQKLSHALSQHGIIVATGLAKGIDTAAATGALEGGSPVIGVIGCGIDIVYPVQNKKLYGDVAINGAIISEYPPGVEAFPAFFPMRNRIISGVSNGVAVIEAPNRSGALITAHCALEQNRDVFVLPGNVDSTACIGSNKLLCAGATPFITADDIIDEYKDMYLKIQKPIDNNSVVDYTRVEMTTDNLSITEQTIIGSIKQSPLYVDEIIERTGISAGIALSSLTNLELEGYIMRDGTNKVMLIN